MDTITCINLPPPWTPNPQEDCPCPQPARRLPRPLSPLTRGRTARVCGQPGGGPSAAALPSTPLSSTLCTPAPSETEVTALCKLLTPACGQPRRGTFPASCRGRGAPRDAVGLRLQYSSPYTKNARTAKRQTRSQDHCPTKAATVLSRPQAPSHLSHFHELGSRLKPHVESTAITGERPAGLAGSL